METKGQIKKIVVVGPESTGKSTLCAQLAAHYKTGWVKEYAREYLEKNGTEYSFEDLWEIACGQVQGEDEVSEELAIAGKQEGHIDGITNHQLLIIDTDLHVIKIWSEFVFNKIDNRILTAVIKRKYDLYLLCDIDLPWVKDELREYPDLTVRKKLFRHYKEEMTEQHVPWVIIKGNYETRLKTAIEAVNGLIQECADLPAVRGLSAF